VPTTETALIISITHLLIFLPVHSLPFSLLSTLFTFFSFIFLTRGWSLVSQDRRKMAKPRTDNFAERALGDPPIEESTPLLVGSPCNTTEASYKH
jgi:hypothetical protein